MVFNVNNYNLKNIKVDITKSKGFNFTKKDNVIEYTRTGIKTKFDVEPGPAQLNGVVIEIDNETGKALSIQRINIAPDKVIGL